MSNQHHLTKKVFVQQSLELNLFFLRIMKEHSLFLEAGFTPVDRDLARKADNFKSEFSRLLSIAVAIADGLISKSVLKSGELVTRFTLPAEKATEFFTGISINTNLTERELALGCTDDDFCKLAEKVEQLNRRAIIATRKLANFKKEILQKVLSCQIFTLNYPLLIDHILREALFFIRMLEKLENGENINLPREIVNQEGFWNRIMEEHALFIRGLLDPTEEGLIETADELADEFRVLRKEAIKSHNKVIDSITERSLEATIQIRNFKAQGTQGILACEIKSIILPLLGDHVLREANHYLRLLEMLEREKH